MELRIVIDDTVAKEVMDAFASGYDYKMTDEEGNDNPVSKEDFMIGKINQFIKNIYTQAKIEESRIRETQVRADAETTMASVSVAMNKKMEVV